jgi:hypothetical protein
MRVVPVVSWTPISAGYSADRPASQIGVGTGEAIGNITVGSKTVKVTDVGPNDGFGKLLGYFADEDGAKSAIWKEIE